MLEDEQVVTGPTRRGFLAGAAATVVLAGCGGAAQPGSSQQEQRTVATAQGQVKIPAQPRRVVCVDAWSTFALLDLGFKPVGVPQYEAANILPEHLAAYDALPKVSTIPATSAPVIDLEKIASLEPDLVLGTAKSLTDSAPYAKYRQIAPTVIFKTVTGAAWKDVAVQAAGMVGRRKDGEALRDRYQSRAASLRERHASRLRSTRWNIVAGRGSGQWMLLLPQSFGGVVLADVGVRFGQASAGRTGTFQAFSYEQIAQLDDADALLVQTGNDGKQDAPTQALTQQPAWQTLKAVRSGHAFPLENFYVLHYKQALAVLDELDGMLSKLPGG